MVRDWRTSAPCFSGEVLGSSDTEGLEGTLPGGEDPREGVEGEVVSKVSADGYITIPIAGVAGAITP
jgi:hypothetical protein